MESLDARLKQVVDETLLEEIRHAHPYICKEAAALRVLKRVLDVIENVSLGPVVDAVKNNVFLEPPVQRDILTFWNSKQGLWSVEEQQCLERVMARDHVRYADLVKLATVMYKRLEPGATVFYKVFAVDGFLGNDPKPYVELLKYGDNDTRGVHVRAVRLLYDYVPGPEDVRQVLDHALDPERSDDDPLATIYVDAVGHHLNSIVEWKRKQLQDSEEAARPVPAKRRREPSKSNRKRSKPSTDAPVTKVVVPVEPDTPSTSDSLIEPDESSNEKS